MTGRKGNSEFCYPETLNSAEIKGKQNSLFPARPVIKCFVIPPNSKVERNCEEIVCFTPAGSQICRSFKMQDVLITCESKVSEFCSP